jgi:hypothetical protein
VGMQPRFGWPAAPAHCDETAAISMCCLANAVADTPNNSAVLDSLPTT